MRMNMHKDTMRKSCPYLPEDVVLIPCIKYPELKELSLYGFELTDGFMKVLPQLAKLTDLSIWGGKVTAAQLLKLLKHGADNGMQKLSLSVQHFEFTKEE